MGPPESRPVPWPKIMLSAPYLSRSSRILCSQVSSASSQLMRSHLPEPRSPARFSG